MLVAPLCRQSPDGSLVASLNASTVTVISTQSLRTKNVIQLPSSLSKPFSSFSWSPSSTYLLVAGPEHIYVFSALDASFHATIDSPGLGPGKAPLIKFGARDSEIIACSAVGLKLSLYDLSSSTAVDVANPKFHHPGTTSKTFAIRPRTGHLAILTRTAGKDIISIHDPVTRQVQRSWNADSVDAQGVRWTPDGQWLLLWESAAHGHKFWVFTPDGELFQDLDANTLSQPENLDLAPGIKLCQPSPQSDLCAIGDYSTTVNIISTEKWRREMVLTHPSTIEPTDTLQVWQEQLGVSPEGQPTCTFVRATQVISPGAPADGKVSSAAATAAATELKTGCMAALFDASSSLLATKLEETPSTLWIWDVSTAELRAVLVFHSPVTFSWHPSSRELLLISCQDETRPGVFYLWDPLSQGPSPLLADDYLLRKRATTAPMKPQMSWLNLKGEDPLLFLSNEQNGRLLSLLADDEEMKLWKDDNGEDQSTVDDTFAFKIT